MDIDNKREDKIMNGKDLPIWAVMPEVLTHLRERRNVVVVAPTGSGKTTQIPQAIFDAGTERGGTILVVQPRRVACRAAARRVAEERGTIIGRDIGYIVRHDKCVSSFTKICFVTDGVLLRCLEDSVSLAGVSTVIFDEFHERRVLSDVALALVKIIQKHRADLRIVVMSATMSADKVAAYLAASIVISEGRSFPVDIQNIAETLKFDNLGRATASILAELHCSGAEGDMLVFLPGKAEISAVQSELRRQQFKRGLKGLTVLPLHAELPGLEQDRVFTPLSGRKIILATNVAETSVTIPGVRIVVDTGLERRNIFDNTFGIDVLRLHQISHASATQRAGRAGRESPGRCLRLWPANRHREDITPPEIHLTDTAALVLFLKVAGVEDVASFDFLEAPPNSNLVEAMRRLKMLGALTEDGELTQIGWLMARLPLSPRYARMMVEAERGECLPEMATIVAMLSCRKVLLTPSDKKQMAAGRHRALIIDSSSDMSVFLEIFRQLREHTDDFIAWCSANFLNPDALIESKRLRRDIVDIALRRGSKWKKPEWSIIKDKREAATLRRKAVRRAIASGLLDRLGRRVGLGIYEFANGVRASLDESSVVGDSEFIVAGKIRPVGIGRLAYSASLAIAVELEMMEQIAPTLFHNEDVVLESYPATGMAKVRKIRRYLKLILEQHETLLAEGGQKGVIDRLSPLSETVARLARKEG